MRKVAVVQPVTEGFGFNITTETNVQLVSFAYATRAEAEAAATHAQAVGFGASNLQPAPSAPMVGRFIGFVEQMKHGCGLS